MGIGLPDELSSLSPQNFSLKTFLYFFLKRPALTDFLISQKIKVIFSYILGNGTLLIFQERTFELEKRKKKKGKKERK